MPYREPKAFTDVLTGNIIRLYLLICCIAIEVLLSLRSQSICGFTMRPDEIIIISSERLILSLSESGFLFYDGEQFLYS